MSETALPTLLVNHKRALLWAILVVLLFIVGVSADTFAQATGAADGFDAQTASVGNYVWDDANADGIQGVYLSERPLAGVVVSLYHASGLLADMTITDSDGEYLFQYLAPGDYYLGFTAPNLMVATRMNQGDDSELDSDADSITGLTSVFTLAAGEANESIDVGFTQVASISSWVWHDEDLNGVRDSQTESGVPAAVVTLYDELDEVILSVPTDVDGYFAFPEIAPGTYRLVVTPPPGMTFTNSGDLRTSSFGGNVNPLTGQSSFFDVHVGPNVLDGGIGLTRVLAPTSLETVEEAVQPEQMQPKQYLPIINVVMLVDTSPFSDGPFGFALR